MTQGAFPATRPSVVRDLGSVDPARRGAAHDALARSYWRPVYVYIRMRWHDVHAGEACVCVRGVESSA